MKRLLTTATLAAAALSGWAWSDAGAITAFPAGTVNYGCETKACPDGTFWSVMYYPNLKSASSEEDIANVVYEYRLQHFDAEGNITFSEPMGKLISDYHNLSYTVVNQYLLADVDGNAIVAVADCRNSSGSGRSYTAYKIAPDGSMLWGDEGVPVSDPAKPAGVSASMSMVQLEDKSVVFAWTECPSGSMDSYIRMQRISADGQPQWDVNTAGIPTEVASYPYLVNSGDNTFIMVYAKTASQILTATKLDFECEKVWGKEVRVYRGGFGSIPLHTNIDVTSSGDGGVLIGWCDDRANTRIESPYLSYVSPEGKLAFLGASDEGDVKLSYEGWRCFNIASCPASDGSGFYVTFRITDADQRFQGVMMQKVNKQGELLWGDNAAAVEPVEMDKSYGYLSVQPAPEGGACAFYQEYRSWYDQQAYAKRLDADGGTVWNPVRTEINPAGRLSSQLLSQPMPGKEAWLCTWQDGGSDPDNSVHSDCINLVFTNGAVGTENNAVVELKADSRLRYTDGQLSAPVSDGTRVNVYNADGRTVARTAFAGGCATLRLPAGFYIAEVDGRSCKFAVR